jgi:DNA-binding Lrp family transcriptional regulator
MLKKAILNIPDFQVLQVLQNLNHSSYSQLAERTGRKKRELRKIIKSLSKLGYVHIDKNKRPHVISFISSPWTSNLRTSENEKPSPKLHPTFSINEEYSKLVEGPS